MFQQTLSLSQLDKCEALEDPSCEVSQMIGEFSVVKGCQKRRHFTKLLVKVSPRLYVVKNLKYSTTPTFEI